MELFIPFTFCIWNSMILTPVFKYNLQKFVVLKILSILQYLMEIIRLWLKWHNNETGVKALSHQGHHVLFWDVSYKGKSPERVPLLLQNLFFFALLYFIKYYTSLLSLPFCIFSIYNYFATNYSNKILQCY